MTYLGPEKFPTRRNELLQKKPSKEITIDQSQLIVKEKRAELTCPTITELEVSNAFNRRALAFDLAGAITYSVMAAYHADLLDHLHLPSPPGYSPVSVQQVLRADRAAFLCMSERLTTLKRNATGNLPLDTLLPSVLIQPTVAFHLLPCRDQQLKQVHPAKHQSLKGKGRGRQPDLSQRTKAEERANQRRASEDPMSPPLSLERHLRRHKRRDCAGLSICQMGATQPNQVKPVPKGCMFVPSQGASSTIRCKIIVEQGKFHPKNSAARAAGWAIFLNRNICGHCSLDCKPSCSGAYSQLWGRFSASPTPERPYCQTGPAEPFSFWSM